MLHCLHVNFAIFFESVIFYIFFSCRRERHDIPLIVQTCVDEVERRGMSEVGIYRVAGVLRDVQELRMAFDTGNNY